MHFMDEFVARFQDRFPALLGLPAWSVNFFVGIVLISKARRKPKESRKNKFTVVA